MGRIQLLAVGDAGAPTGFGRVVRGILERLADTGRYDIVLRGIGFDAERHAEQALAAPYRILPAYAETARGPDQLGASAFGGWVEEHRPDTVLLIQDLWNVREYLVAAPRGLPVVGYFPVDTPNMKWDYALAAAGLSMAVSYTHFGAMEAAAGVREAGDIIFSGQAHNPLIRDGAPLDWFALPVAGQELQCRMDRMARYQNVAGWSVVPHGAQDSVFRVRPKATCRAALGLPPDAFLVLNVNTNQFRKRQDLTIRAFAEFAKGRDDCYLVLHCAGGDRHGWDLAQLGRYYGIQDRLICPHYAHPELTEEQLAWLYGSADVQLNTGGGEGWGLTSFEGAACGVPQLVPDWSATRELWKDHGRLLRVSDYRFEPKGLNTAHAIVDVRDTAEALTQVYSQPDYREHLSALALAQAERQIPWSAVGDAFDLLLQRSLAEPRPAALSFQQLFAARDGAVQSELAGRPLLPAL